MYRISNEEGREASSRNIGRLALFIIPLALGLAASIWLGVWIQAHYFLINKTQEQRVGVFVNTPEPEKIPYNIILTPDMNFTIDKVVIQNGQMTVLFHNSSNEWRNEIQLHWQWIAKNNIRLADHYINNLDTGGPSELRPNDQGLVTVKDIHPDAKAVGLEIRFTSK